MAKRYEEQADQTELPGFMHTLIRIERDSKMNLKGRNFLTLKDFTPEEITYLIDLAADLKEKKKKGIPVDHYRGKNVALIFEKTSTRTRCAFEVAAHERKALRILPEFWEECSTESSIVDMVRRL